MKLRACLPFLLLLALCACKPSQDPAAPAAEAPATAPTATAPAPADAGRPDAPGFPDAAQPARDTTAVDADVVGVRLSNQGDTEKHTLGAPTTSFGSTDTVYAEVETNGTAGEYTLYAKWFAPDGTELADYGMRINEAGPKRTVISLSKPDGWASGQGKIEIAINGELEETVTFDVP
jgi:hypothetical protein